MNKKKILLISGGLLTLVLIIISIVLITNNNEEKIYTTNKRKENVNNFLTLMLEQSDGTYKESTSNTWPGEGYIFNKELSSCQNGGELDYDSENNKVILYSNKSDGCYVYFDLYTKPTINSINLGEVTNNSITITVSATNGTNEISNYYYIINDGTPVSTTSNTYTFNGLDSGITYTIKVYVVDSQGYSSDTSSLNVETNDTPLTLADACKKANSNTLACHIAMLYTTNGKNGLYYHDANLENGTADNSYRYSGGDYKIASKYQNTYNNIFDNLIQATCTTNTNITYNTIERCSGFSNTKYWLAYDSNNTQYSTLREVFDKALKDGYITENINNYVCFGSDAATCPNDNLYRIIGVFNGQVKLIKLTSYGSYEWSSNYNNTWSNSDIRSVLNNNFLNTISLPWQEKISIYKWYVGGLKSTEALYSPLLLAYSYEIGLNRKEVTDNIKIGLMYISDYGYAASPTVWSENLSNYNIGDGKYNNWLFLLQESIDNGFRDVSSQMTISRNDDRTLDVYYFNGNGLLYSTSVVFNSDTVRPCFYLNSDVEYVSGTGTQSDPFRIQ